MLGQTGSSNHKRKLGAEQCASAEPGGPGGQYSLQTCAGSLPESFDPVKRLCTDQSTSQSELIPKYSPGGLSSGHTPQSAAACLQIGFQRQAAWPVPPSSFDTPHVGILTPATSAAGTSECYSEQTMQSAVLPSWQRSGAAPEAGAALTRSNSAPDMRLLLGGFSGQTLPSMQSLPPFGSASTGNALAPYLAPEGNRLF